MHSVVRLVALVLLVAGDGCLRFRLRHRPPRALPESRQRFLLEPCCGGRLSRPFRHPRRQRLLGHGDDVAVGADLPAPPFDRPRELAAGRRSFPDAARVVGRQLLGAGDRAGRRPFLRLLHREQEGRTALRRGRRRRRPEGPYTDHGPLVCQEPGSIDAAPIRDENGRRYLVWKEDGNSRKQPTPLWAQPLSDDGPSCGRQAEILRNEAPWEAHLVEGPFILRRGEWFYMFYSADACCGRRATTSLALPAPAQLLGPWERNPDNPILAGNAQLEMSRPRQHRRRPIRPHLPPLSRVRCLDFEYVGRQGLLDEVTWDARRLAGDQRWPRPVRVGRAAIGIGATSQPRRDRG